MKKKWNKNAVGDSTLSLSPNTVTAMMLMMVMMINVGHLRSLTISYLYCNYDSLYCRSND